MCEAKECDIPEKCLDCKLKLLQADLLEAIAGELRISNRIKAKRLKLDSGMTDKQIDKLFDISVNYVD